MDSETVRMEGDQRPHCTSEKREVERSSDSAKAAELICGGRTGLCTPSLLSTVLSTIGFMVYSGRNFQYLGYVYYLQSKG